MPLFFTNWDRPEGGRASAQPALGLGFGKGAPPRDGGSRSGSSCTGGSAPLSPTRGDSQVRAQAVAPSITLLLGAHVTAHGALLRCVSPAPDPQRGGVPGPHPVPARAHDPRGEPAKMAAAPRDPERTGPRTSLLPRALAQDSLESGAAAGPALHGAESPKCYSHVLERRPPGRFVGGAAGSHPGHGPGSPCTWPGQPLKQACAWQTLARDALVKRTNL